VHLRVPHAVLRRALGEMSELLLEGQNAVPAAALAAGYRYRHPVLEEALAALARPPSQAGGRPDPAVL
jgi:NAD dependent epimerase/dehydratase family enzyme